MGFGRRGALATSSALVALTVAGSAGLAASIKRSDLQSDERPAAAITNEAQGNSAGGGIGGFNWSFSGQNAQPGQESGQNVGLGYESTTISMKGKWDNRYSARGGMSFGATLDEAGLRAIGGGFLTSQRASEFYGQYQFVAPEFDALSAFTVGEHVNREEQYFSTGGRQVWAYTTYLNWFKRNDGSQSLGADAPPGLRDGLQAIMNHLSAISGTAAYTYAPVVNVDDIDGSPRTNALDLSLRGVTPSPLGRYLPVSAGVGGNYAHYKHYDGATEGQFVVNGGLGIAFLGGEYFSHELHWLAGLGADHDSRGVTGGTVAAELGPISVSYRQTSDQQTRILASWRVSDLFADSDRQKVSTLAVADGGAPLSFSSPSSGMGELTDRIARAEGGLRRLGFMPPTGEETTRSADGKAVMRLTPASAAVVPDKVQEAITRTQELKKNVQTKKQESTKKSSSETATNISLPATADFSITKNTTTNKVFVISGTTGLVTSQVLSRLSLTKTVNNNAITNDPTSKSTGGPAGGAWGIVDNGNGTMNLTISFTAANVGTSPQDTFRLDGTNSVNANVTDTFVVTTSPF